MVKHNTIPASPSNASPDPNNPRRQESRDTQPRPGSRRKPFVVQPKHPRSASPTEFFDKIRGPPSLSSVFNGAVFNLEEDLRDSNIRTHVVPTSYPNNLHVQSLPDTRANSRRQEFNPRNPTSSSQRSRPHDMYPDGSPHRHDLNDERGSPTSDWPSSSSRSSRLRNRNLPKSDPILIPPRRSTDADAQPWSEYERNRRASQAALQAASRARAESIRRHQKRQASQRELSSSSSSEDSYVGRPPRSSANWNPNRK